MELDVYRAAVARGEIETELGHFGRQILREAPRAWIRDKVFHDPVLTVTAYRDVFFVDYGDGDWVLCATRDPVEDRFLFMPYDRRWPRIITREWLL